MVALLTEVLFSAWQEVLQQEVGQAAQKAVHYKEATPSPHMDGEYSYCFSFLCYLQTPSLCFLRTVTKKKSWDFIYLVQV